MHTALIGIFFEHHAVFLYQGNYRISNVIGLDLPAHLVLLWVNQNLTHSEYRAVFEFHIGAKKPHDLDRID
jgi:hypothetical protein